MDDKREVIELSPVQMREMIKGIGKTVIETVTTAETELVEQGREKELVQLAVLTGALNAIGAYVAVRVYPEADQRDAAEDLQIGLHRAVAALVLARQFTAAESEDAWPTGRFGTA